MNSVFRVIWSQVQQAFVVVDEHASRRGKRGGARLLLALAGAGLLGGSGQAAADTVSTLDDWDGSTSISSWSQYGTQRYGQTITFDSSETLNSFTFELSAYSVTEATQFRAYVYEWSGSGITGTALYTSDVLNSPTSTSFTAVTVDTNGIKLEANKQYVLILSTVGVTQSSSSTSSYRYGTVDGTTYTGGSFVFLNGTVADADLTGVNWSNFSGYDLAFVLDVTGATSVTEAALANHNSPAYGAARVIDATPALLALFEPLDSEAAQSRAASATLPSLASSSLHATTSTLGGINRVIQARQAGTSGMSSGDAMSDRNLWIKSFGSWADQSGRSGVDGYKANSKGLAIGVDAPFSDSTRLGVAFAYARTQVDGRSSSEGQSADIDTYQLIGYGSYALAADTELNFQLDAGQNRTDGKREMAFAGSTAKSNYDGYSAHAGVGLAHSLHFSDTLTFIPEVRADYTWIGTEAYHEKGASVLNLDVDRSDVEQMLLSLNGKVDYKIGASTVLSASLGAGYDLINDDASVTSAYAGAAGSVFKTSGMDMEPWLARAGFGLTHTLANGTEVSLNYDAEARSGYLDQGASLKARWAF